MITYDAPRDLVAELYGTPVEVVEDEEWKEGAQLTMWEDFLELPWDDLSAELNPIETRYIEDFICERYGICE